MGKTWREIYLHLNKCANCITVILDELDMLDGGELSEVLIQARMEFFLCEVGGETRTKERRSEKVSKMSVKASGRWGARRVEKRKRSRRRLQQTPSHVDTSDEWAQGEHEAGERTARDDSRKQKRGNVKRHTSRRTRSRHVACDEGEARPWRCAGPQTE